MTIKRYRVQLTGEEREELQGLTMKGRVSARKQTHARILLQCDEGSGGWWADGLRGCGSPGHG